MGCRLVGATLNQRINRAIDICERLARQPWSRENKVRMVIALVLPTALYGSEAAPPAERVLARLATAIAKAIGPHSADTSNTMAFHISSKFSLEPGSQILLRRMQLARRIFAKHPWTVQAFQRITTMYEARGIEGVISNGISVPLLEPCPPCGAAARGKWTKQAHTVQGPVGLLCTSLAEHRACIRPELIITAPSHIAFHLQHVPYQCVSTSDPWLMLWRWNATWFT